MDNNRNWHMLITKSCTFVNIPNNFYHLHVYIVAPKPVFKPLVEKKETPINQNYDESHISKDKGEKVNIGMLFVLFCHFTRKAHIMKDN